jgi:hypothetical protein
MRYEKTKYSKFILSILTICNLNISLISLFILSLLASVTKPILTIPTGGLFILIVFLRTSVNIIENIRISRICKKEGITTDEFNALYS